MGTHALFDVSSIEKINATQNSFKRTEQIHPDISDPFFVSPWYGL